MSCVTQLSAVIPMQKAYKISKNRMTGTYMQKPNRKLLIQTAIDP